MSQSFWFRATVLPTHSARMLVWRSSGGQPLITQSFIMNANPDYAISSYFDESLQNTTAYDTTDTTQLATWYHLASTLKDGVCKLYLNNHKHIWKEFINILLNSNSTPVIFHCSAGKDRTGIASYIIQKLLNNSIKLIYENYLLSNELLSSTAATAEQTTSSKRGDLMITRVMLETLGKVQKSYLNSAINEIEEKYQTLESYIFNELGFNQSDIIKLNKLYCNK